MVILILAKMKTCMPMRSKVKSEKYEEMGVEDEDGLRNVIESGDEEEDEEKPEEKEDDEEEGNEKKDRKGRGKKKYDLHQHHLYHIYSPQNLA